MSQCGCEREVENMGVVSNIKHDQFPKQGTFKGAFVMVCFHYDREHEIPGVIVRDDEEEPFETIIALEDGRVVRATECQYKIVGKR